MGGLSYPAGYKAKPETNRNVKVKKTFESMIEIQVRSDLYTTCSPRVVGVTLMKPGEKALEPYRRNTMAGANLVSNWSDPSARNYLTEAQYVHPRPGLLGVSHFEQVADPLQVVSF